MYSDKKSSNVVWILPLILVFLLAVGLGVWAGRSSGRDLKEEAVVSVKEAVERAALQCYVVEGAFPADLDYLMENYGLSVNTRDYYIRYEAFASNLPPTVIVEPKAKE